MYNKLFIPLQHSVEVVYFSITIYNDFTGFVVGEDGKRYEDFTKTLYNFRLYTIVYRKSHHGVKHIAPWCDGNHTMV